MSTSANSIVANGTPSVITDDVPSCFTSPSTNNGPLVNQPAITKNNRSSGLLEEMRQSVATVLNHAGVLVSMADGNSLAKIIPRPEVKPSLPDTKLQNEVPQTCLGPAQIDHVDTSSSGTSACISQTDVALQQNFAPPPYYTSSLMFRDTSQDEVQTDPQNNTLFGVNIDGQLGIPLTPEPSLSRSLDPGKDSQNQVSAGPTLSNYSNPKEIQPELSSSMVYQSFGVPSVAFNSGVSVDSGMNDDSFLNRGSWIQPQYQRMRTFTKVYKRGAVGRSIDVTRYKGYDELRRDLARMFGIEGQLEDPQRIGWKLVYVDHENDVLLVGDDPWEEFVNCVRCIKILSPTEIQQMSLEGDITNNALHNQACSSSDGVHV
ncbi:unnamed protein product [Victoria cruziana]